MEISFQVQVQFWETWKEFEVKHGNEDTVREMLRIKRAVQATYNTSVNVMSAQMLATTDVAERELFHSTCAVALLFCDLQIFF